jgi:hypothetical protein
LLISGLKMLPLQLKFQLKYACYWRFS